MQECKDGVMGMYFECSLLLVKVALKTLALFTMSESKTSSKLLFSGKLLFKEQLNKTYLYREHVVKNGLGLTSANYKKCSVFFCFFSVSNLVNIEILVISS